MRPSYKSLSRPLFIHSRSINSFSLDCCQEKKQSDSSHSLMDSTSPSLPTSILPIDNAIRSEFFTCLSNFDSSPTVEKAIQIYTLIYKLYTSEPQEVVWSSHCLLLWKRVIPEA
ncbi:hypothetical protein PFISCL1PPCAC_23387, partial [Pristionchus fissidentatus]